jgi:hypothetical protein
MAQSPGRPAPAYYRIRVDGHLDDHWSAWFAGLTLTHESAGTTSLSGPISDQAELHGLLTKVRDLGVPLISVAVIDLSDNVDHKPDSVDVQKVFAEQRTHQARATSSAAHTQRDLEGSAGDGHGEADPASEDLQLGLPSGVGVPTPTGRLGTGEPEHQREQPGRRIGGTAETSSHRQSHSLAGPSSVRCLRP